jgi:hypothetical protein
MRAAAGVVVAILAGCGADRYGAYLQIRSDTGFDHVELFFGGKFLQRKSCQMASLSNPPPVIATAAWPAQGARPQDPSRVTMWRRQYHADTDSVDFVAGTKEYDVRIPTLEDDADFTDSVGSELFVYTTAHANGGVTHEYAELQNIEAPTDFVNVYPVHVATLERDHEIEQWGTPGDMGCLRSTLATDTTAQDTTFIVREWDHDCDGIQTKLCPASPSTVVDCDPESFCVPSPTDDCPVAGACMQTAIPVASASEQVCSFATCSNPGGHRLCGPALATGFECISADMCDVDPTRCDRRLDVCAFIDPPVADYRCDIPVSGDATSGRFLCDTTATLSVPLMPTLADGVCPSIKTIVPKGSSQPEIGFGIAIDSLNPQVCNLILKPSAIDPFHALGFLPTLRLLLELPGATSTMLLEVNGSKACGDTPACSVGSGSGSGSDPFLGMPHSCTPPP